VQFAQIRRCFGLISFAEPTRVVASDFGEVVIDSPSSVAENRFVTGQIQSEGRGAPESRETDGSSPRAEFRGLVR